MISIGIHAGSANHRLKAEAWKNGGVHGVAVTSGNDGITIFLQSMEHAERIADAMNWRQEPQPKPEPPTAEPVAVDDTF